MKAKNVIDCFANHSLVNEFFVTSDEQVFFTENDAFNNTSRLKDKKITQITRAESDMLMDDDDLIVKTANAISDTSADFTQVPPKKMKTVQHEVTLEDLDKNPDLEEEGIKVGDLIDIEVEDTEHLDENLSVGESATNLPSNAQATPKKAAGKKAATKK